MCRCGWMFMQLFSFHFFYCYGVGMLVLFVFFFYSSSSLSFIYSLYRFLRLSFFLILHLRFFIIYVYVTYVCFRLRLWFSSLPVIYLYYWTLARSALFQNKVGEKECVRVWMYVKIECHLLSSLKYVLKGCRPIITDLRMRQ